MELKFLDSDVKGTMITFSFNARAAIRIQWTKLKTVPIQLQLDEIRVSLETCEELRYLSFREKKDVYLSHCLFLQFS